MTYILRSRLCPVLEEEGQAKAFLVIDGYRIYERFRFSHPDPHRLGKLRRFIYSLKIDVPVKQSLMKNPVFDVLLNMLLSHGNTYGKE